MSEATDRDTADSLIAATWGHPAEVLRDLLRDGQVSDPALVAVLRIRGALIIDDGDIAVHRDRIHRLTRPGHVPLFHDLKQLGTTPADLLTAHAGSQARMHAIRAIIEAYPEGHLAEQLAQSLNQSATTRAEAARARSSSTPAASPPQASPSASAYVSATVPTNSSGRTGVR